VRGTTRRADRLDSLEAAGIEAVLGDPDRVMTLSRAFEHVAVTVLLLGSAVGGAEQLAALHGSRLDMLLARMLDSTVRGIVYEAGGSVDPALLAAGAQRVMSFCEDSRIPYALLEHAGYRDWVRAAVDAVDRVLG
jgi:uncharacterized protein YbjT (DUF2867 family)